MPVPGGRALAPGETPWARTGRRFEPFPLPDSLDPVVVGGPALNLQRRHNPLVAMLANLDGPFHDPFADRFFVRRGLPRVALGGARLCERPAGTALRDTRCALRMVQESSRSRIPRLTGARHNKP